MSSQIQITGETKVKSLTGVLVGTSGVVSSLAFDVAGGVPKLDANAKILVSQLPNSVMEYQGTWNATTNVPYLVNGVGNAGDVWLVSTGGVHDFGAGAITFVVSDQVIFSNVAEGSIWQKASGSNGTVTSVAVTESGDSLNITGSPITTSGTINIGFNGTNLQYVNGAGNLTTFPILTGYVTAVSGTAPVVSSGGTTPAISMAAATGSVDGYLSAVNFAIFSAKQSALTFSSPLVNTSGTISIPAATTSVNGYLASADFTTFNNKQNAITLTTTGSSGVATFVGATLNIPNYGSVLTGYVPYTGATQDVDLGAFKLNAQSLHIKGTAGNGHLGLKHQSASATASANEVSLFADSLGDLAWLNGNLYLSKFITSGNTAARSYTFPNANGTVALTSDISYPVTSVFGRTGAVVATIGDYTTAQVTEVTNLYFTDSRARLALSFVAGSGAYNNTTGVITIPTNNNQITNGAGYTTNVGTVTSVAATGGTGISITGSPITTSGTITITNTAPDQTVAITASTGISVTGTYPNFTITNTSPSSGGTVTSVAALTLGTTGTDLSSTVATSTTTPVITLNVPTASATNRGALSSADFTTFNNKQGTITLTTTGTSGAATFTSNTLNIPNYGSALSGYLPLTGGTLTGALTINLTVAASAITLVNTSTNNIYTTYSNASNNTYIGLVGNNGVVQTNNNFEVYTGSAYTKRLTIDASGNLGLGVTPSAWASGIARIALQVGVVSVSTNSGNDAFWGTNYYDDGTNNRYINSDFSLIYAQQSGSHIWYNAPSGTAGNAITFTQAMTLNANGSLGIGTATMSSGIPLTISAASGLNTNIAFQQNSVNKWFIRNLDSSDDFSFYYAPSSGERLRITSGGNVLIGTTTDAGYKLDVNGTGRFTSDLRVSTGGKIYYETSGTGNSIYRDSATGNSIFTSPVDFKFTNATASTTYLTLTVTTGAATFSSSVTAASGVFERANDSGVIVRIGNTGSTYFDFSRNSSTGALSLQGNQTGNNNILLAPTSGNVGIGTSSPSTALDVRNISTTAGTIVLRLQSSATDGYSGAHLYGSDAGLKGHFGWGNGTSNTLADKMYFGTIVAKDVVFTTTDTERMRITSGGVLQITNSSGTLGGIVASERLNINGDVFAYGSLYVNTNIISYGTITTGPTGYGAGAFKIGPLQTGTASSAAGCIPIIIDGTLRYINVFNAI